MILVDAAGISASRPERPLFRDLDLTLAAGDRLGVVGVNGAGKSTLLRILAGADDPEAGAVRRGRGVRVAALDQRAELPSSSAAEAVGAGWRGEAVLDRLGLGAQLAVGVETLSVGQRKRVALAKTLVAPADLLVLDEPTNHLDLDAIEWLEHELARFRGGLVMVTHDRRLLDRLANRILELDRGRAHLHADGYSAYLAARAERSARASAAEAARRNLARRELAWLRRGAPARTRKPKARLAAASTVIGSPSADTARKPQARMAAAPSAEASGRLDLDLAAAGPKPPRLGDLVIELHGVEVGYPPAEPLVRDLDLLVDRGARLGLVGPNGAGKSSLLDVMAGRRAPSRGRVVIGPTVRIGYHDQRGSELDPALRVHEAVAGPGADPGGQVAALLERFWFDADAQRAPIGLLSGGERRRLQLVITLAAAPNVLLLDEPTNDLDLDTLRALEDLLDGWPGAVIAASHDRAFLDRTVEEAVVLDRSGRTGPWPGGYGAWLDHRRRRGPRPSGRPQRLPSGGARRRSPPSGRSASTIRRELAAAERDSARWQRQAVELADQMKAAAGDHETLARLGRELTEADEARASAEDRWLELSVELDERSSR